MIRIIWIISIIRSIHIISDSIDRPPDKYRR